MTIRCYGHPGGPVDLDESLFYPSMRNRKVTLCRECHLRKGREKRKHRLEAKAAPTLSTPALAPALSIEPVTEPATETRIRKIGGYYIHENALLIADVMQAGKVVLYTTILEIDGETKHPRNKRIIFTQQNAPDEYRAMLTWLGDLSDRPADVATANEQAALQLAEEATSKLAEAENRIKELESALAPLKALLGQAKP